MLFLLWIPVALRHTAHKAQSVDLAPWDPQRWTGLEPALRLLLHLTHLLPHSNHTSLILFLCIPSCLHCGAFTHPVLFRIHFLTPHSFHMIFSWWSEFSILKSEFLFQSWYPSYWLCALANLLLFAEPFFLSVNVAPIITSRNCETCMTIPV